MKARKKPRLIAFDIADHLDSPKAVAEYLTQVLADGDPDEVLRALGHVARARGMAKVAARTGLGRESLYKALTPGAKPRHDTIMKITRALGVRLTAVPA